MGEIDETNRWVFDFLRRRCDFVEACGRHRLAENIDGHVIWSVTVAALGRIHARRLARPSKGRDRESLVDALLTLAPGYGLATFSVPLLFHDLKWKARHLLSADPVARFKPTGATWLSTQDQEMGPALADLYAQQPQKLRTLFLRSRYADVLYREYRCSVLHGFDLGRATMTVPEGPASEFGPPFYGHHQLSDDPDIPPDKKYRIRIMFPLPYLAEILNAMINEEERATTAANWRIPRLPTLE